MAKEAKKKVAEKASVLENSLLSEKEKILSTAVAQIEKQFGKGSIMKLGPIRP